MAAKKGATAPKKASRKVAPKRRRLAGADDIAELEGFEVDEDLLGEEEYDGEDEHDDEGDEGDEPEDDDGVAVDEDELPGKTTKGKGRQRKLTEEDKIRAFRDGKRGFAEGREVQDWPTGLNPELYNDWSSGWRVAQAEEQQGAGITVYCIFPADLRDIAALEQVYRERWRKRNAGEETLNSVRTSFPALPWDMQALRGTTWRNIHTGSIAVVNERVSADGWGHPHLAQCRGSIWTNERYPSPGGLGIWTEGKYGIEHWVPLLDWAPEDEIQWYAKEVANNLDHIASAKADAEDIARNPDQHSCASTNYGLRISEVKSYTQRVREIRAAMEAFAQQRGLAITPELLNGTRFRRNLQLMPGTKGPARVEQMMLI